MAEQQTENTSSSLSSVIKELRESARQFQLRGLKVSSRFALELINGSLERSSPLYDHVVVANGSFTGLPSSFFDDGRIGYIRGDEEDEEQEEEEDIYNLARAYFDDRQFLRASTLLDRRDALLSNTQTGLSEHGRNGQRSGNTETNDGMISSTPFRQTVNSTQMMMSSPSLGRNNPLPMHLSEKEGKTDSKQQQYAPTLKISVSAKRKRRSAFLRMYSRYLDGENRKEAERAQGGDSLARTKAPTNPSLPLLLAELTALDDRARTMANDAKVVIESSSDVELEALIQTVRGLPFGSATSSSSSSSSMMTDERGQTNVNTSMRASLYRPFEVFSSQDSKRGGRVVVGGGSTIKEREARPSWNTPGQKSREDLMSDLPQWHTAILAGLHPSTASNDGSIMKKNETSTRNEAEEQGGGEKEEEGEDVAQRHQYLFYDLNDPSTDSTFGINNTSSNSSRKIGRGISAIGKASLDLSSYPVDGYLLWLLGVVLRDLDRHDEARHTFLRATRLAPLMWSAWADLISVCSSRSELESLQHPHHFMAHLFKAHALLELQASSPAALQSLQPVSAAFPRSSFVKAMAAKALYNLRRIDQAQVLFEAVRAHDPHRIEDMDIYSNILYVKGETARLATLAHELFSLDRFTPQTCCVVGNYFSARREHEKAVVYFRRCLRLNPQFLSAWTLMGHEYVEMKNTAAAIECYRRAVDGNSKDYRAWYGLGQTYELLQMYLYASYYYRRACSLRPKDARMWCALGTCYESLERKGDAIACFERAAQYSDRNGVAALRLARLYRDAANNVPAACKWFAIFIEERENAEMDATVASAAASSSKNVNNNGEVSSSSSTSAAASTEMGPELSEALLYLAKSAWEEGRVGDAETFAARVLSTPSISAAGGKEARVFLNALRASILASSDKTKGVSAGGGGGGVSHGRGGMNDKINSSGGIGSTLATQQSSSLLTAAPRGRKINIAGGSGGGGGGGSIHPSPSVATTPLNHHTNPSSSSSSIFPPPQAGWLSGGGGDISLPSPPLPSGGGVDPTRKKILPSYPSTLSSSGGGGGISTPISGGAGGVGGSFSMSSATPVLNELEPGLLEPSPALSRGISFTRGSASGTRRGGGGHHPSSAANNNLSFEPLLSNSPSSMDSSDRGGAGGGGGGMDVTAGASPLLQGIDASISLDLASPSIALSFGSGGGADGGGGGGGGIGANISAQIEEESGDGMDVDESG